MGRGAGVARNARGTRAVVPVVATWPCSIAIVTLAAAAGVGTRPLPAQEATAVLRGVITDTAGTPVPYALVRVLPVGAERFTDARGGFALAGLRLGSYRLQARQVGYEQFEASVDLGADGATVRVGLRPLAIRLEELTVSVAGRCRVPGSPDQGSEAALSAVFAQLRENARRFAVLADSYPFRYDIERTYSTETEDGEVRRVGMDTVSYQSTARPRYRPGRVVGWSLGPRGARTRSLELPSLPDLADSAFVANHCFGYGGTVERDGRRLLRLSFRAAESVRTPDVNGEADLDVDSYQLRTLTVRLTRADRAMPGLATASAVIELTELFPGLLVPGSVRSVVEPTMDTRGVLRVSRYVDVQRLLRVHFLRASPAGTPAVTQF